MDEVKEVRQIPIEDIIPNRFQPRINFDEKALIELSNSIKQHGIIQPLVLRPLGDKFEIIAGERRYKAATLAGLSTVPAIVTEMDDGTSAEVALIENVQRKDLNAIEEAKSYKNMLDRGNITQEELAKKMGLSQSTIANKLRLLNLSDDVQNALMHEKISERHARALLSIPDKDEQKKWLDRIINERLTVRQLDLAIKDELNEKNNNLKLDNDIAIVDINPDIESIINNAVDINPTVDKKEINVFDGILGSNENNVNTQNVNIPTENIEISSSATPNKFFNFLEDQEVNMNMNDEVVDTNNSKNAEIEFNFQPEFKDAPENIVLDNEIDTLDDLSNGLEKPVIENASQTVNNNTDVVETPIFVVDDIKSDSNEDISKKDPDSNITNNNSFVFDDEPDLLINDNNLEIKNDVNKENEPIIDNSIKSNEINNDDVEPIPIMTGEGIVDPVMYYDTLDPEFINKIRESEGLDLKTAINTYRDITSLLNEKGFTIKIDEVDMNDIYRVEIDIKKE